MVCEMFNGVNIFGGGVSNGCLEERVSLGFLWWRLKLIGSLGSLGSLGSPK